MRAYNDVAGATRSGLAQTRKPTPQSASSRRRSELTSRTARVDPNASAEQEVTAGAEGCQLLGNHHDPGELLVAQRRNAEQWRAVSGVGRVERRRRGDKEPREDGA